MTKRSIRSLFKCLALGIVLTLPLAVDAQDTLRLYAGAAPNSKPRPADKPFRAAANGLVYTVDNPCLEIYLPEKPSGTAAIVIPGGSYAVLSYQGEGIKAAKELAKNGITAFILKYRLPSDALMVNKTIGPLQDAQQAIKLVREGAAKWGIDVNKVGVIGFSAGGHLASTLATHYEKAFIDNPNNTNLRPDFLAVVYPVISMQPGITHAQSRDNLLGKDASKEMIDLYSNELQVTEKTPPTYITHAGDDKLVDVDNSIFFYEKLRHMNVPAEMHLYAKGGHGFLLRQPAEQWASLMVTWMKSIKMLSN